MQYIATIADDNITTELYSFVASLRANGYKGTVLVYSPEGHNPPSLPDKCKQVSIPAWWHESFTAANTAALIKPDIFLDANEGDTVLYMDSADLVMYCNPEIIFERLDDKLLLAHQYKTKRNKYNKLFPTEISDRLGLNRKILPPDRAVNSGVICAKITDRLKSAMYLWRAILKCIPAIGALMHHGRVGDQLGFNYIFRQIEAEGRAGFLPEEYNYRPGIAVSKLQFKNGMPITRGQKPIYVPHSTGRRKLPDKIRWNASEGIKQKPSDLKIDVITPAYKATEVFINRYLQSIDNQTIVPDNILIGIDNCEQTRRNLQKAKPVTNQVKTFWFDEHCGPYLIRNTLAEISDADVLLFFDIDDEMYPQYVARLGICCSSGTILVPCSQWIKNGKVIRRKHSSYCQFGIKRQDFLYLKGFEPWECHADWEFQVRAKQQGIKWHKLNSVLFNQYKHNGNLTVREDTKPGSNKRNYYDSIVEERKKNPIIKQTLETTEYELAKSNKTNY